MKPKWFSINDIPYESMWEDDKHWLPHVLSGEKIKADFYFDKKNKLLSHNILEVTDLY